MLCFYISRNLTLLKGANNIHHFPSNKDLRRHNASAGAEWYNKGSWHERTSQNNQRQGKKEDSNSSKAKPFIIIELKSHHHFNFLFLYFGAARLPVHR